MAKRMWLGLVVALTVVGCASGATDAESCCYTGDGTHVPLERMGEMTSLELNDLKGLHNSAGVLVNQSGQTAADFLADRDS